MQRERKGRVAPADDPQVMQARRAVPLFVALLAVSPLGAQWLNYPTPGVPRTPDGKPNLSAPAPRTADGKPDFSGIWDVEHNRPCPVGGCTDMEVPQEFINLGWSLKGGLPYQPWARDLMKARSARNGQDDPGSVCMAVGIVKMLPTPLYKKFIQLPGLLVILHEREVTYRQIFTDGRPLPTDPNPSATGYSSAKWEGDTLVVQSIGFKDGIWLDRSGSPLTEGAKMTERIRRPNFGNLEIEVTVDDPKAYTAPWTVTLHQILKVDTELMDYVCSENERDSKHLTDKGTK